MKKLILSLALAALLIAGLSAAADFATPVSAGSDEVVTIQKRTRISEIHITRSGIVIASETADINAANGQDRRVNKAGEVTRPLSAAILAETVTIGGQQVSLDTLLKGIAKFQPRWLAEDIAAAAAAQNP